MILIDPLPAIEAQKLFAERFETIEAMRSSARVAS
jgi:hypothetical protein